MSDEIFAPGEGQITESGAPPVPSGNLFALTKFVARAKKSIEPQETAAQASVLGASTPSPAPAQAEPGVSQPLPAELDITTASTKTGAPNPFESKRKNPPAARAESTDPQPPTPIPQFAPNAPSGDYPKFDFSQLLPETTASAPAENQSPPVVEQAKPVKPATPRFSFRKAAADPASVPAAPTASIGEHIQKNHAPRWVAAAGVFVAVTVSIAVYLQKRADDIANETAEIAIAASKATASTLGSGFIMAANSMPLSTPTVPKAPPSVAVQPAEPVPAVAPAPLAADGEARYRKMLAEIESKAVISPNVNTSPRPVPGGSMPYTPPPVAKKLAPTEMKTVPMLLEDAPSVMIEEREPPPNAAPVIYGSVTRASPDVPYSIARIDTNGKSAAYIVRTGDGTGAWLEVGDVLEGGFTIAAIYPFAVVVLDSSKRPKTLRMLK